VGVGRDKKYMWARIVGMKEKMKYDECGRSLDKEENIDE
jgi:hypothetical protein